MLVANIVRSAADVAICQDIRFQVYCRERQFLRESDYPSQLERDNFDGLATHLAIFGPDGEPLGTARIVLASMLGFPFQRYCDVIVPKSIRETTGEVSRLAIPRSVTRQYSLPGTPATRSRQVSVRLYQMIYDVAKQKGLTHLVAAMEPSLVRICGVYDIPWKPIGPEVDCGGLVRPYLLSLAEFDAIMSDAAIRFRRESAKSAEWARCFPSVMPAYDWSSAAIEADDEAICDGRREARAT